MQDKTPSAPRAKTVLGELADVDLRLLRVLKAVAECGGFSATELKRNTSTVSRHVADLKSRLGLTLWRRTA